MESRSEFACRLRTCPLVHGFLNWPDGKSGDIRQRGLLAPGPVKPGFNSFDYDEILERKTFVFLSTLKLHPDYTYNCDAFVLLDPLVLLQPGVEFSVVDIAQVIDQIKLTLGDDASPYPQWVRDPETFHGIIEREAHSAREAYALERGLGEVPAHVPARYVVPHICASEAFRRYWRCYSLDQDQFFDAIAQAVAAHHWDLAAYVSRDWRWPLKEEILVPIGISSDFLLGFWDGRNWQQWNDSSSPESREMLERFLAAKQVVPRP